MESKRDKDSITALINLWAGGCSETEAEVIESRKLQVAPSHQSQYFVTGPQDTLKVFAITVFAKKGPQPPAIVS